MEQRPNLKGYNCCPVEQPLPNKAKHSNNFVKDKRNYIQNPIKTSCNSMFQNNIYKEYINYS